MSVIECGCTHSGGAAVKIGLKIAYSFWLGSSQACDACPLVWSHSAARPGQGLFCSPLSSLRPRCSLRRRGHQSHTSFSSYAGRDFVEVLTKCRVQHLSRGDVSFVAAEREATGRRIRHKPKEVAFLVKRVASLASETPEDSLMSTVLPSIIVLVITALLVFRRELTTRPAAPASKLTPGAKRRSVRQSKPRLSVSGLRRGGSSPVLTRQSK